MKKELEDFSKQQRRRAKKGEFGTSISRTTSEAFPIEEDCELSGQELAEGDARSAQSRTTSSAAVSETSLPSSNATELHNLLRSSTSSLDNREYEKVLYVQSASEEEGGSRAAPHPNRNKAFLPASLSTRGAKKGSDALDM